jgi:hypothetical protein
MLQACVDELLILNAEMQVALGTVHPDLGHTPAMTPDPEAFTVAQWQVLNYLRGDFWEFIEEPKVQPQVGHGGQAPDPAMADTGHDPDAVMEGVAY